MKITRLPSLLGSIALAALLSLAAPSWATTLTLGSISATPVEETRTFQPFADYLGELLAADGVDQVKVVIAPNIAQMAALMKNGKVDLFIDSSVTALAVNKLSGSSYMLRRWKKGRDQYRSVIFVRDDSSIHTLDDLNNHTIAFEEPFSTSGFMLPAMAMRNHGLDMVRVNTVRDVAPADKVAYIMAYDAETQATWLERDRVHAAAMADADFEDFAKTAITPLRVLYTTDYVPYHVMTHSPVLDPHLVERIKAVLKTAHETEQGRAVLKAFERTAKFDDIPAPLLDNVLNLAPHLDMIISPAQ
ncbi:MAG TPA: phosphate/phosphite/phosphonate ABC transporter substrate-binding protein [Magnetovibrio sp.]